MKQKSCILCNLSELIKIILISILCILSNLVYGDDLVVTRQKAEQGNALAQLIMGRVYFKGEGVQQDYNEAVRWYRRAAEQGLIAAQLTLASMYAEGDGVFQDYEEAIKWCRRAAEKNNATAQCALGLMYYTGEGVKQDYNEAMKWYLMAAEQGNIKAQCSLAMMYAQGEGVQKNNGKAAMWYHRAAEQGDAEAQCFLAMMYIAGIGVKKNEKEALKWYRRAAEQNESLAQAFLIMMPVDFQEMIHQDDKKTTEPALQPIKTSAQATSNNIAKELSAQKESISNKQLANEGVCGSSTSNNVIAPISAIFRPYYPLGARKRGEQGTVTFEVLVSCSGTVTRTSIRTSSGFPELDASAERTLKRARFKPGTKDGKPIEAIAVIPISFKLIEENMP